MVRSVLIVALGAGCNRAPWDYRDVGRAPGGVAPWGTPTEVACDRHEDDPDDVVVDGFTLCARDNGIVEVDDPILVACADVTLSERTAVFTVFDGLFARAYAIDALVGRELVHDTWGDAGPLLIDW